MTQVLLDVYTNTLNLFNKTSPGYGFVVEAENKGELHCPVAYALFASAEAHRFRITNEKSALNNAINAALWLAENPDLDNDGEVGWGVPYAWDPGNIGYNNPEHTVCAVPTALGIQALLDTYEVGINSERSREVFRFLGSAVEAAKTFINGRFDINKDGLIFWFSKYQRDSYHVINASALLTGQLQRLSNCLDTSFSYELSELATLSVKYIQYHLKFQDGYPYWMYFGGKLPWSSVKRKKNNKPNDLVHEMFILQGLLDYKNYGGRWSHTIDDGRLISGIAKYVYLDKVCEFPYQYAHEKSRERWARLWGVGHALYLTSRWESFLNYNLSKSISRRLVEILLRNYYSDGTRQWIIRPGDNRKSVFYPRHVAHALLGLSYYVFRKEF